MDDVVGKSIIDLKISRTSEIWFFYVTYSIYFYLLVINLVNCCLLLKKINGKYRYLLIGVHSFSECNGIIYTSRRRTFLLVFSVSYLKKLALLAQELELHSWPFFSTSVAKKSDKESMKNAILTGRASYSYNCSIFQHKQDS